MRVIIKNLRLGISGILSRDIPVQHGEQKTDLPGDRHGFVLFLMDATAVAQGIHM